MNSQQIISQVVNRLIAEGSPVIEGIPAPQTKPKAYQAHSKHGQYTSNCPRRAALGFFLTFPKARKCNVIEGEDDGYFFTVKYGRYSTGEWPKSWKDITAKTAHDLPAIEV